MGAFLVGTYELLHGLGILLFRTGMLGVLGGIYTFGGFCLYCLLHWTLGWFCPGNSGAASACREVMELWV